MKKLYLGLAGGVSVLAMASVVGTSSVLAETTNNKLASEAKINQVATVPNTQISESVSPAPAVDQISQVRQVLTEESDAMAQNVTSVSQLSDVKPTDWAFTALQSLVERYGCIAGYPDRTFRGQRSLSRYEFAAGLNACLDKVNELISSGLADKVSKADLAALRKLQEEFAAELATLRGRVDSLEAKTAKLEAQQFSTTTKLAGSAIFAITGGGAGNNTYYGSNTGGPGPGNGADPIAASGNVNTTFNTRVRLDFNTSFTGNDLLITRLEGSSGGATTGNVLGSFPAGNVGNIGFQTYAQDYGGLTNGFILGKLRYDFNVGPDVRVSLGPVMHAYDHVDVNSYANNEAADFISTFFINNPLTVLINPQTGGAGAFVNWNPGQGAFSVRALYLAANGADPTGGVNKSGNIISNRGLTGDPYQGTVEIEFAPKNGDAKGPFAIRLNYTQGSISNVDVKSGGVNIEWAFAKGIAIFGRYGFGTISSRNGVPMNANPAYSNFVNRNVTSTDLSPQTFMAGIAFPDLFKPGALAAIAVGQPFIESKVGNSTQTNVEAFYNFPVTDNITITPNIQFIFNGNNNSANSTVTVGTLRTVFSF